MFSTGRPIRKPQAERKKSNKLIKNAEFDSRTTIIKKKNHNNIMEIIIVDQI